MMPNPNHPTASPLWLIALIGMTLFFTFQLFYTWQTTDSDPSHPSMLPNGKTLFLTFEETNFGTRKRGFDTLFDKLETYRYEKDTDTVWIKPVQTAAVKEGGSKPSQLPRSNTQVMAIYDKGFDSFQKREDILPIASFPYEYQEKGEDFFEIRSVDKDGNAYLTFRGKRLKLDPGSRYPAIWFDGLRLKMMVIHNHGVMDHDQFKEMNEEKGR